MDPAAGGYRIVNGRRNDDHDDHNDHDDDYHRAGQHDPAGSDIL